MRGQSTTAMVSALSCIEVSVPGSLSISPLKLTGSWITGGTGSSTKPYALVEPVGTTSTGWNTAGTGLGINAPSGFTGNLIDLQLGGTSRCRINYAGQINLDASTGMIGSAAGTVMKLNFSNGIQLGNQTGIGISWSNNINPSTSMDAGIFRDDIGALGQRFSTTAQAYSVYGTYTSAAPAIWERMKMCYNSGTTMFELGTEKGSGGGAARDIGFLRDGLLGFKITAAGTIVFSSSITSGLSIGASQMQFVCGNNGRDGLMTVQESGGRVNLMPNMILGWRFTASDGSALDAAFSRLSASSIGVGNGTAGDTSGKITAAGFITSSSAINAQTGTTYTLLASDNGKIVKLTNASAITLTVPAGLPIGFSCQIVQGGAGDITIAASGTTVNSCGSLLTIAGQYASASLFSDAADTFILAGNLK